MDIFQLLDDTSILCYIKKIITQKKYKYNTFKTEEAHIGLTHFFYQILHNMHGRRGYKPRLPWDLRKSCPHKLNKSIFMWTGFPLGAPRLPRCWALLRSVPPRGTRNRFMPESVQRGTGPAVPKIYRPTDDTASVE